MDPRKPALIERSPVSLDGQVGTRLMFIFRAPGCTYALGASRGCRMCGFLPLSTHGEPVGSADLIAQFDSYFGDPRALDGVIEVDLYNSGSFFSDREIPAPVRAHVLGRLGRTGLRRVLVESRPEYITAEAVAAASALVSGQHLEIGIGLESATDRVRDELIRKGFGRPEFEAAVHTMARFPVRLLVYLLVKPPGLGEAEAREDAVNSARYVFKVAGEVGLPSRVAVQPVFVAPGTALEEEFLAGHYQPPSLWSVIDVVRRIHDLCPIIVGMSDEGLRPHLMPRGCDRCTPILRAALTEYNRTADTAVLSGLDCACRSLVPG